MNVQLKTLQLPPIYNSSTVGELVYDADADTMLVYTGKGWRPVSDNIEYCSLCEKADWAHDTLDHPLFHNNLEYLEWKSEQVTV